MSTPIQHHSWPVSPYSAKTRAYLRFKRLPFVDNAPSYWTLSRRIKRAVGRAIMPTVELPDGTWLQDSSEIIDTIEAAHPEPGITPPGPRQRVVNLLLELHGDEWLPLAALHYRWNNPQNTAFALGEFGRFGFPGVPAFLARRLAAPVAGKMQSYLPLLGIDGRTHAGIESFTETLLARLDTHLAEHAFVFGGRPALADFALYATPWAHLYRDIGSTRLFDDLPHVRAWFERLRGPLDDPSPGPPEDPPGEFLADDEIPATLLPILTTMLVEQGDYIARLVEAIDNWCDKNPEAERVPRSLGSTPFTVGGAQGERRLITEGLWMVQRPLDAATPEVMEWLRTLGPLEWSPRHRVVRWGFKVVLEGAAAGA